MALQAEISIAVNSTGATSAKASVAAGGRALTGSGASQGVSAFAKLLGKNNKAQDQGLVAAALVTPGAQTPSPEHPPATKPDLLRNQARFSGVPGIRTIPALASAPGKSSKIPGFLQNPGVQTGQVLAGASGKAALAAASLKSPGVQTGPVLAGKPGKVLQTSGPSPAPVNQAEALLAGAPDKIANTPDLAKTPGMQTGPVLTGKTGKSAPRPGPIHTPGAQAGPIITGRPGKNVKTQGPIHSPGIQTGPVITGQPGKSAYPAGSLKSPGMQTGPVLAGQTGKAINPQATGPLQAPGIQIGSVERQSPAPQDHNAVVRGHGQTGAKPGEAQVSALLSKTVTAPAKAAPVEGGTLSGVLSTPDSKASHHARKNARTNHGKTAAPVAAAGRPAAGNAANGAIQKAASASSPLLQDQGTLPVQQDKPDTGQLVQGTAPKGDETMAQVQDVKNLGTPVAQLDPGAGKPANAHTAAPASQNASHNAPRLDQAMLANFAASLAHRVRNGASKFAMRLDPPELGRVHIRLDVSADHKVEAIISTHRPDVLADLQRGADSLRRALVDAGFDPGRDGLSFTLDQGTQGQDTRQHGPFEVHANASAAQDDVTDSTAAPLLSADRGYGLERVFGGGVDISI